MPQTKIILDLVLKNIQFFRFNLKSCGQCLFLINGPVCNSSLKKPKALILGKQFSTNTEEPNNCNTMKKDSKPAVKKDLVFLIGVDGKILGTKTKLEAEQLARKNKWNLVEEKENTTGVKKLPTFKLLSSSQLQGAFDKGEKSNKSAGSDKQLSIAAKIASNDLQTKIKIIRKLIEKGHDVRLLVNGDSTKEKQLEDIYRTLEEGLVNEARFLQKRIKNGMLKVTISNIGSKKQST